MRRIQAITVVAILWVGSQAWAHDFEERRGIMGTCEVSGNELVVELMMLYEMPAGPRTSLLRAQYGLTPHDEPSALSAALLGKTLWPRMSEGLEIRYEGRAVKASEHRLHAKVGPKGGLLVASFLSYRLPLHHPGKFEVLLSPQSEMWPLQVVLDRKASAVILESSHPLAASQTRVGPLELIPGSGLTLVVANASAPPHHKP